MLHNAGLARALVAAAVAGPILVAGPALADDDDGGYRLEITSSTVKVRTDRTSWGDERRVATVRLRAGCDDDEQSFGFVRLALTQRNVKATDGAWLECGDVENLTVEIESTGGRNQPWRPGPAVVEAAMYRSDGSELVDRRNVRLVVEASIAPSA